jgi:hypothetical protein
MKKLLILLGFIAVVTVAMASCKSTDRCPAYGQIDTEQQDANV